MPAEEYEYNDEGYVYFEDENDNVSRTSSDILRKNEDTFTKVERRNKKKNRLVVGKDEYGNEKCIFGSKGQGTYIISATTGYPTSYKVGSSSEDLFFSVIDSRAHDKIKEPIVFYFDSPEQFERVMSDYLVGGTISQKTKEVWHKKFLVAKNRIVNKV
jgi:hypothetical protein